MNIIVGSGSDVKVNAVRATFSHYDFFRGARVIGKEVGSGVSAQPMNLEETVRGARNRARNAFANCDYSVGIESGIMPVLGTLTGHFNICAAAIWDGRRWGLGLSSGFEHPQKVVELVTQEGLEIRDAYNRFDLLDPSKLSEGGIGMLTRGRFSREAYIGQALEMALISFENPQLYP